VVPRVASKADNTTLRRAQGMRKARSRQLRRPSFRRGKNDDRPCRAMTQPVLDTMRSALPDGQLR